MISRLTTELGSDEKVSSPYGPLCRGKETQVIVQSKTLIVQTVQATIRYLWTVTSSAAEVAPAVAVEVQEFQS